MSDSICLKCGGLIMEQGKCYGYAGKACQCVLPRYVTDPMFVPQKDDAELTRLKRLVEVLSNLKFAIIQAMFTLNSIGDATDLERVKKAANHEYLKLESALEALAAAERIGKGEV